MSEDASAHEIRRAYRRLARQHHPHMTDRTDAADRFNALAEAYQVLYDPTKRASYDRSHRVENEMHGGGTTDLEAILELSPQEAALAEFTALTLTDGWGNAIELPAGIRHGQRIRFRAAARLARSGVPSGDVLLTVHVRPIR